MPHTLNSTAAPRGRRPERSGFACAAAVLLALAGLVTGGASPAQAVIGATDVVPAATLLLPYFEVDLANEQGVNTLFSVYNTSATGFLAHVTVWTDWSIPVLDWDIYLTGYDVQSVNLRDVLVSGVLPHTASDGQDPDDDISNHGAISQDINFASCTGTLPYAVPAISASFKAHLQALLTGKKSPVDGTCAAANHGDSIARGYVTVDITGNCSLLFPASAGYFVNGGGGVARNQNVLSGDFFLVHPAENFAQGNPLVHIEAAPGGGLTGSYPAAFAAGDYTFYGRYVGGTAIDNREPLASTWFSRYLNGGGFSGGTDFLVWRDSKFVPTGTCAAPPAWYPLGHSEILVFDEQEEPFVTTTGGPSGEPVPGFECTVCLETQRVGVEEYGAPFDFGWIYFNLNHATVQDGTLGPGYSAIAQSWVVSVMDASGRFSVGYNATPLENAGTESPGGIILTGPF